MRRTVQLLVVCAVALAALSTGCSRNEPPVTPQISGPILGRPDDTLTYTFSTTDPDNQELEYMVAWGDTNPVEWSPLYPSGQTVTRTHIFADTGVYHVKVKARDTRQAESEWSVALDVTIAVYGGPPTGVAVSAGPGESDSTVVVSWTVPAEGAPDKYTVYFQAVTEPGFAVVGETTGTSYVHNPQGMTGQYKVAARFGQDVYDGAERPTTVPIPTDATMLSEINADPSRCGFGWSRDSGHGGVFAMSDSVSCASVDFYVSDLQVGVGGSLSIVSPNVNSIDPGAGIIPSAGWRTNGFSNPVLDPQSPLPGYEEPPPATYFIYTEISTEPCYIGCYTAGETVKHYALIQVDSFDVTSGRVWMKSWYQPVPGLRLIRH